MDISGKVTIITGASEGIGLATARVFSQAGAKLALVARSKEKLEALAQEFAGQGRETLAVPADLRDPAAIKAMVETAFGHFGRIDILINNAGQAAAGTVAAIDIADFQKIMALNVYGPVHAIQAVAPKMRKTGGGLIVNISSMVSKMKLPGLGAYAATKAALNLISDTARVELAPDNIRVVTVFPRATATDFGKHSLGDQKLRQEQRSRAASNAYQIDSAEYVAGKILNAVKTEQPEQYMEN